MNENMVELEQKVEEWQSTFHEFQGNVGQAIQQLYDINNQMLLQMSGMLSHINKLEIKIAEVEKREKNLAYEVMDTRYMKKHFYPKFSDKNRILEEIRKKGLSLARFGDGEFSIMLNEERPKFQKVDDRLAERMQQVLASENSAILIAIADNYGDLGQYTQEAADGIRDYMTQPGMRERHYKLLKKNRVYADAYVSRPYVMYRDHMTEAPFRRFEQWKQVWKDRDVILVEGEKTRVGVGNDLLDSSASVRRILCPAVNAFDRYEDILNACRKYAQKDELFLVALGPTASVLAYDLTIAGYQAIDVGHLDLEYEWFLAGKGERVRVPYKYNNEIADGDQVETFTDLEYEAEVIVRIV